MKLEAINSPIQAGIPLATLLVGVGSLVLLVITLALCACLKSSNNVNTRKKPAKKTDTKNHKISIHATDIDIEVGGNQTNGAVSTGNGDRPKSHDRALPEIPAVLDPSALTVRRADEDDDDITDDGLYDVISKRPKRHQANGSVKTKPVVVPAVVQIPGQNPYEIVPGDLDASTSEPKIEAMYSMPNKFTNPSKKVLEVKKSVPGTDPLYSGVNNHDNGSGDRNSDPDYAGIDQDDEPPYAISSGATIRPLSSTGVNNTGPEVPLVSDVEPVFYAAPNKLKHPYATVKDAGSSPNQGSKSPGNFRDTDSIDTLNTSVSSVQPPPVPLKHLDATPPPVAIVSSSSPVAPISPNPAVDMVAMASPPAMVLVDSGVVAAGSTSGYPSSNTGAGAAGPAKREPPYHKVTVRESLANVQLRMRQEEEQRRRQPSALPLASAGAVCDVDYDQINYDQIKSPSASGGTSAVTGGDTGSELYAEIGGSEAPIKSSSTYASVTDSSSGAHAPTPPPVDCLKQLKETLDPGYSQIGGASRSRPHSTTTYSDVETAGGATDIPLYAEVDKTKKTRNRQTVHYGDDLERLYAKVNKNKSPVDDGPVKADALPSSENNIQAKGHGGARPKVRSASKGKGDQPSAGGDNGASSGGMLDPGYSTIDSALGRHSSKVSRNSKVDHYEIVENVPAATQADASETGSEYDPNYESVATITRSSASPDARPVAVDTRESGVAREITPGGAVEGGSNEHGLVHVSYNSASHRRPWDKPGLIREHIYQEIPDKDNSKRKNKETSKKGKHGRKDSGSKKL